MGAAVDATGAERILRRVGVTPALPERILRHATAATATAEVAWAPRATRRVPARLVVGDVRVGVVGDDVRREVVVRLGGALLQVLHELFGGVVVAAAEDGVLDGETGG